MFLRRKRCDWKTLPQTGCYWYPVFSREETTPEGTHSGYVHAVYEKLLADKHPSQFYLCGWKNMIDEAKQRIVAAGYDKKDIHLEIYG